MRNSKEVKKVITDMLYRIDKIEKCNYAEHHKIAYQASEVNRAYRDIEYYQDESNFVI